MTGVVVTGGTGGIGRAVVEHYADADVVFSYHRDAGGADALVGSEVHSLNGGLHFR